MNKIKILIITFIITIFSNNAYSQIYNAFLSLYENGIEVSNNTVDLGNLTSKNLDFSYGWLKPINTSFGSLNLNVSIYSSTGIKIKEFYNNSFTVSTPTHGIILFTNETINRNDVITCDGTSYIQAVAVELGGMNRKWSSVKTYIKKTPVYSLTTNNANAKCGTSVRFTSNSESLTGNSYNWSIGAGWSYNGVSGPWNIGSTGNNYIDVVPNSGTLGQITCTASFLGQVVTTLGATLNYAPLESTATIIGSASLCTTSTYTIGTLPPGQSVTNWSVTDPTLASLSATNGPTTKVTKLGNGVVFLRATITNICGETLIVSKKISIGAPFLPNDSTVNGPTYTGFNQTLQYTFVGDATNGNSSYQWTVDAPFNDNGGPSCGWQILSGQGSKTVTLKSGCIASQAVVRVAAIGSCGNSNMKYIYVTVGSTPCPPSLRLSQNPISDSTLVANLVYPPNCNGANLNRMINTINNEIKIYDYSGSLIYNAKQNSDELILNNLELKKGIYLMNVITNKGEVLKEKLIVD